MGEEPGWGELLGAFVLAASIPVVVGGALICALVGLSVWVSSAVRRRRPGGGGGAEAVRDPNGPA